jgi:hypothetical protein
MELSDEAYYEAETLAPRTRGDVDRRAPRRNLRSLTSITRRYTAEESE